MQGSGNRSLRTVSTHRIPSASLDQSPPFDGLLDFTTPPPQKKNHSGKKGKGREWFWSQLQPNNHRNFLLPFECEAMTQKALEKKKKKIG